jgi:hypothetical protein
VIGSLGVVAAGVFAGGSATSAGAVSSGASTGSRFVAIQAEFPLQLAVRGERVRVGYEALTGADGQDVPGAVGTLFVRNDLRSTYTRVALRPATGGEHRVLRAAVPNGLLRGHRLFYYAVIRSGGSVRSVPAGGARAPESVWIINRAFRVNLGAHVFGRTRAAGPVVAKAGPGEVGFNYCPEMPGACGDPHGPLSFEVTKSRSVWLFDNLGFTPNLTAGRLLVWAPGRPAAVARTVQLPFGPLPWNRGTDFAVGPAGSVYVLGGALPTAPPWKGTRLTRLSAGGKVLWTSRVFGNLDPSTQLRTGPDGTLYWTGPSDSPRDFSNWQPRWVPVATPAGRPLSLAAQERGTRWTQPLAGGLRLVGASAGWKQDPGFGGLAPHEARLALVNRAGRVVRAWRVTSPTILWWYFNKTPGLVGGDPVIVLTASAPYRAGSATFEYLVLRLGPRGGVRTRFSLPKQDPPLSAFNDRATTEIRVQPDGWLYQLGSAPDFGAAIYRYSLARTR